MATKNKSNSTLPDRNEDDIVLAKLVQGLISKSLEKDSGMTDMTARELWMRVGYADVTTKTNVSGNPHYLDVTIQVEGSQAQIIESLEKVLELMKFEY